MEDGLDVDSIKTILNKDLEYNKFEVLILNKDLKIEDISIFTDIGSDLSLLKKQFQKFENSKETDVAIPEYSLEFLKICKLLNF